jgi:outer membrane protein assembly factor BamB
MTTASEDGRELFAVCLDKETGRVLLDRKLLDVPNPEPLGNDVNSYASPTPLIEEGRVILHFGGPGTFCLNTKNFEQLWARTDLKFRSYRGPSSSPVAFGDTAILTFDGADQQFLIALNRRTGATVWKTNRSADWNDLNSDGVPTMEGDLRKAHSTPLLVQWEGRPVLLSAGAKAAYAYDPRDGKELWRVSHRGYSASIVPMFGHGFAYLSNGYGRAELMAVRMGGTGDVTKTHIAWKASRMVPSKPSPLLIGDLIFMVNDSGVITCLDAKTGDEIWQERIPMKLSASPLLIGARIYIFAEEGDCYILTPSRRLEKIAENRLETGCMATPAVSGKALFVRTKTHVYRIEE